MWCNGQRMYTKSESSLAATNGIQVWCIIAFLPLLVQYCFCCCCFGFFCRCITFFFAFIQARKIFCPFFLHDSCLIFPHPLPHHFLLNQVHSTRKIKSILKPGPTFSKGGWTEVVSWGWLRLHIWAYTWESTFFPPPHSFFITNKHSKVNFQNTRLEMAVIMIIIIVMMMTTMMMKMLMLTKMFTHPNHYSVFFFCWQMFFCCWRWRSK